MNRRCRGLAAWSTAALLVSILCACGCGGTSSETSSTETGGSGGSSSGPKLLFVTNSNADWWNAVEKGMLDGGKEFGCQVEMRRNDKETPGQIRLLEDAISLPDIDGVAVSVYEAEAPGIADALRALNDAGKIVITIDSDISPSSAEVRRGYIGTNNFEAGKEAGNAAKILRPEGGKVCVFVGTSSAANAIQRREGFFEGAGDAFVQTEVFDDNSDKTRAQSNVQTALSKYPDVGLLLGLWSYNAARIAEEVSGLPTDRPKPTVVTFDLDELAVGHLEKGNISATVCQNPYEMGHLGVKLLKALIEKDEAAVKDVLPDGQTRDTGVRVVVPDAESPIKGDNVMTIDQMKEWLKSKGLKST